MLEQTGIPKNIFGFGRQHSLYPKYFVENHFPNRISMIIFRIVIFLLGTPHYTAVRFRHKFLTYGNKLGKTSQKHYAFSCCTPNKRLLLIRNER